MKARDKKELACVVVVVALAMFYVLFAMMIRGFFDSIAKAHLDVL